jgi:L-amino acid N-acyltransferase YncA
VITTRAEIRDLRPEHWPEVAAVYQAGIETGNATFETATPSWEEWDRAHLPGLRVVAIDDGRVVGWAALSRVSTRSCYAGVAEVSVYVAPDVSGRGVGRALLETVIARSEGSGIWTIQAGSSPRTRQASRSTNDAASASWACASALDSCTASGVTSS